MAASSRFPVAALASLLLTSPAFGNLPAITLSNVMPPGGRVGTEVEVTVSISELEEATALHFSHPGLTAKLKADKQFIVTIAPDVPLGVYDLRVIGKAGISNPRAFVVGEWPEAVKKVANDQPETATELAIGSVFNGTVPAAASDYFRFTAKKGERLFLECAAADIDSRLSPVLALLDAAGVELETSRRSGLIDFTAPADGTYLVRLNDLTFAGSPEHFYRLSLTAAPRVDFVFPPSAVAGSKGRFTVFGRALPGATPAGFTGTDGKPLEKLDVDIEAPANPTNCLRIPAAAPLDGFPFRLKTDRGTANPVFISLAATPPQAEVEPNQQPTEAQKLTVPCEVGGQFFPASDVDSFRFEGKKGDLFWIEVISQRLGLPTNPFLLVTRDGAPAQEVYGTDANAGGPKFSTVTHDPATRLEVKEDGAYTIQVRDLFGTTRKDPRCVYRLVIRREAADFRLAAFAELPPKKDDDRSANARAVVLRGGETTLVRVIAFRRDGFAGDIEVSADALPPGVTFSPAIIRTGKNDALLLMSADENAPRWTGAMRIVGKAKIGDAEVTREARAAVVTWNVGDFNNEPVAARFAEEVALCVEGAEPAPISVEPAEDKVWEIAAGAKLDLPLKITRRGNTEPLKLKAFDAPAIEGLKEIDVDGPATTATATIDLAAVKIPAGAHTIHFRAQTKAKFRTKEVPITVVSAPIRLLVK